MARSHLVVILEKRIQERVHSIAGSVATGEAPDYPQYKFLCGRIRGLEDALLIADEIEQEFEKT